jgi:hypothetical protein
MMVNVSHFHPCIIFEVKERNVTSSGINDDGKKIIAPAKQGQCFIAVLAREAEACIIKSVMPVINSLP